MPTPKRVFDFRDGVWLNSRLPYLAAHVVADHPFPSERLFRLTRIIDGRYSPQQIVAVHKALHAYNAKRMETHSDWIHFHHTHAGYDDEAGLKATQVAQRGPVKEGKEGAKKVMYHVKTARPMKEGSYPGFPHWSQEDCRGSQLPWLASHIGADHPGMLFDPADRLKEWTKARRGILAPQQIIDMHRWIHQQYPKYLEKFPRNHSVLHTHRGYDIEEDIRVVKAFDVPKGPMKIEGSPTYRDADYEALWKHIDHNHSDKLQAKNFYTATGKGPMPFRQLANAHQEEHELGRDHPSRRGIVWERGVVIGLNSWWHVSPHTHAGYWLPEQLHQVNELEAPQGKPIKEGAKNKPFSFDRDDTFQYHWQSQAPWLSKHLGSDHPTNQERGPNNEWQIEQWYLDAKEGRATPQQIIEYHRQDHERMARQFHMPNVREAFHTHAGYDTEEQIRKAQWRDLQPRGPMKEGHDNVREHVWHITSHENLPKIRQEGLRPGMPSNFAGDNSWSNKLYGGKQPVYLSNTPDTQYAPLGTPLKIDAHGEALNPEHMRPDFPSLIDHGLYIGDGEYWFEKTPKPLRPYADEYGIDMNALNTSHGAQAAAKVTGTFAYLGHVKPEHIHFLGTKTADAFGMMHFEPMSRADVELGEKAYLGTHIIHDHPWLDTGLNPLHSEFRKMSHQELVEQHKSEHRELLIEMRHNPEELASYFHSHRDYDTEAGIRDAKGGLLTEEKVRKILGPMKEGSEEKKYERRVRPRWDGGDIDWLVDHLGAHFTSSSALLNEWSPWRNGKIRPTLKDVMRNHEECHRIMGRNAKKFISEDGWHGHAGYTDPVALRKIREPGDLPRIVESTITQNKKREWRDQMLEKVGGDSSEIVHELDDGYKVHRLNTYGDLYYEGHMMDNCIKDYGVKEPCEWCDEGWAHCPECTPEDTDYDAGGTGICQYCHGHSGGQPPCEHQRHQRPPEIPGQLTLAAKSRCIYCGAEGSDQCEHCKGTGTCSTCGGEGRTQCDQCGGHGWTKPRFSEPYKTQDEAYQNSASTPPGEIYSLRDEDNIPVVSWFHPGGDTTYLGQCYGRGDTIPKPEHQLRIMKYLHSQGEGGSIEWGEEGNPTHYGPDNVENHIARASGKLRPKRLWSHDWAPGFVEHPSGNDKSEWNVLDTPKLKEAQWDIVNGHWDHPEGLRHTHKPTDSEWNQAIDKLSKISAKTKEYVDYPSGWNPAPWDVGKWQEGTLPASYVKSLAMKHEPELQDPERKKGYKSYDPSNEKHLESWAEFRENIQQKGVQVPLLLMVNDPEGEKEWRTRKKDQGVSQHVNPEIQLEGHHRLLAAEELGIKDLPVEVRYFGKSHEKGRDLFVEHEKSMEKTADSSSDNFVHAHMLEMHNYQPYSSRWIDWPVLKIYHRKEHEQQLLVPPGYRGKTPHTHRGLRDDDAVRQIKVLKPGPMKEGSGGLPPQDADPFDWAMEHIPELNDPVRYQWLNLHMRHHHPVGDLDRYDPTLLVRHYLHHTTRKEWGTADPWVRLRDWHTHRSLLDEDGLEDVREFHKGPKKEGATSYAEDDKGPMKEAKTAAELPPRERRERPVDYAKRVIPESVPGESYDWLRKHAKKYHPSIIVESIELQMNLLRGHYLNHTTRLPETLNNPWDRIKPWHTHRSLVDEDGIQDIVESPQGPIKEGGYKGFPHFDPSGDEAWYERSQAPWLARHMGRDHPADVAKLIPSENRFDDYSQGKMTLQEMMEHHRAVHSKFAEWVAFDPADHSSLFHSHEGYDTEAGIRKTHQWKDRPPLPKKEGSKVEDATWLIRKHMGFQHRIWENKKSLTPEQNAEASELYRRWSDLRYRDVGKSTMHVDRPIQPGDWEKAIALHKDWHVKWPIPQVSGSHGHASYDDIKGLQQFSTRPMMTNLPMKEGNDLEGKWFSPAGLGDKGVEMHWLADHLGHHPSVLDHGEFSLACQGELSLEKLMEVHERQHRKLGGLVTHDPGYKKIFHVHRDYTTEEGLREVRDISELPMKEGATEFQRIFHEERDKLLEEMKTDKYSPHRLHVEIKDAYPWKRIPSWHTHSGYDFPYVLTWTEYQRGPRKTEARPQGCYYCGENPGKNGKEQTRHHHAHHRLQGHLYWEHGLGSATPHGTESSASIVAFHKAQHTLESYANFRVQHGHSNYEPPDVYAAMKLKRLPPSQFPMKEGASGLPERTKNLIWMKEHMRHTHGAPLQRVDDLYDAVQLHEADHSKILEGKDGYHPFYLQYPWTRIKNFHTHPEGYIFPGIMNYREHPKPGPPKEASSEDGASSEAHRWAVNRTPGGPVDERAPAR